MRVAEWNARMRVLSERLSRVGMKRDVRTLSWGRGLSARANGNSAGVQAEPTHPLVAVGRRGPYAEKSGDDGFTRQQSCVVAPS